MPGSGEEGQDNQEGQEEPNAAEANLTSVKEALRAGKRSILSSISVV